MGLSQTFTRLAAQCCLHLSKYRSLTQNDPVLRKYPAPADVVDALALTTSSLSAEDRNTLLLALIHAHCASPHEVWNGILLQAFAPMLLRLRSAVRGVRGSDLEQQILISLIDAFVQVGATGNDDRPAMYLRQRTARALFAVLRRDSTQRSWERNRPDPGARVAAPPTATPDLSRPFLLPEDPTLRAALAAQDKADLRALVRQRHGDVSEQELERIYRRIQRRRHRFIHLLREKATKLPRKRPSAEGSRT